MYSKAKQVGTRKYKGKEKVIADMNKGETGWAVPWAYDEHGFLNLNHTICSSKHGTATMYVSCNGYDDYEVCLTSPCTS